MQDKKNGKIIDFFRRTNLLWFAAIISAVLIFIYFEFSLTSQNREYETIKKVYYADNISPAIELIIERFNKEYQGSIEVIPVDLPFTKFSTNERKELLTRSLRSKSDRIDIFAVDIIWVPRFAKWAEPMDIFYSTVQRENLIDYSLKTCSYNGRLMALPLVIDIGTMYYRKDLLEKLPDGEAFENKLKRGITWDEMVEYGLRNAGDAPFYTFPAAAYEGLICSYVEMVLNEQKDFFAEEPPALTSETAVKSLQLLVDLVNKYGLTPEVVTDYKEFDCHELYIEEDGLLLRSWPAFIKDYELFFADTTKSPEFVRVPVPSFGSNPTSPVFGGWNLMISKFSNNKHEAMEFVKFLLTEESQMTFFKENGNLPVLKSMYENHADVENDEVLSFYKEYFNYGVYRPFSEKFTRLSDILAFYLNKAITKELTVREALRRAKEMIKENKVPIQ